MKIEFNGPIESIERVTGIGGEKLVKISLLLGGNVEDKILESKKALLQGVLTLKPIVADQLKIGTILNIIIEDDL